MPEVMHEYESKNTFLGTDYSLHINSFSRKVIKLDLFTEVELPEGSLNFVSAK